MSKHVWPNKIWLEDWPEKAPRLPVPVFRVDEAILAFKLAALRESTILTKHPRLTLTQEGVVTKADIEDEWGVAFGRVILRNLKPNSNCTHAAGCGGFNETPVTLVVDFNNVRIFRNADASQPSRWH
jgi:hypothetical protein